MAAGAFPQKAQDVAERTRVITVECRAAFAALKEKILFDAKDGGMTAYACCRCENQKGETGRCQQVKDLLPVDEGVGVTENPRSGVGARGSRVKSGLSWAKLVHPPTSTALPLLNLLTVGNGVVGAVHIGVNPLGAFAKSTEFCKGAM
jgi:hypothetical protein